MASITVSGMYGGGNPFVVLKGTLGLSLSHRGGLRVPFLYGGKLRRRNTR